jgi:ArsR family transcriptional regulator
MIENVEDVEQFFKGLGDRNRLRILNLLLETELCGCDLQLLLGASQPNISRHLAYLKHAGLLEDRRAGFRVFYRIAELKQKSCKVLFQFLRQVFDHEPVFRSDSQKLRHALRSGACSRRSPPAAKPPKTLGSTGAAAQPGSRS